MTYLFKKWKADVLLAIIRQLPKNRKIKLVLDYVFKLVLEVFCCATLKKCVLKKNRKFTRWPLYDRNLAVDKEIISHITEVLFCSERNTLNTFLRKCDDKVNIQRKWHLWKYLVIAIIKDKGRENHIEPLIALQRTATPTVASWFIYRGKFYYEEGTELEFWQKNRHLSCSPTLLCM